MRPRAAHYVLALLAATGILALPPTAGAQPAGSIAGSAVGASGESNGLSLRTPNGYLVNAARLNGAVAISVAHRRGKRGIATTVYVARGTASRTRLRASFGRFGRISMRFRPGAIHPRQAPPGRCHGPGTRVMRRGVFVGTLRFRGEGGYVSIDTHRAKGAAGLLARNCPAEHRHHRHLVQARSSGTLVPARDIRYLAADWRGAVAAESFAALGVRDKALFIASTERNAGRVSIFRIALAIGPTKDFRLSDALSAARVSPPAPFRGSGSYRAAPDGESDWVGPLGVDFLGAPLQPLTGPPLEASVGSVPASFALGLLRDAEAGRVPSAAITESPSLLLGH